MMKLVYFGIVALLALARQINADCGDLTFDNCVRERDPFETVKNKTVATCQSLCQIYQKQCTFFIFNQEHSFCELFDFDIGRYKNSCRILSLTPDVDISKCYDSTDLADPCFHFIEENCRYNGDSVDEDFPADSVEMCQQIAIALEAPYYIYNKDEENCALYSSKDRTCDLIFGPPTPDYDVELCGDEKPPKSCPEGWLDSPEGCFYFATDIEAKTWDEAVEYCQELGGYLAEVLNDETQRFLVQEAMALGTSTNWWLGATDQESEGVWVWTKTGKLVDLDSQAWYPNQPSNGIPLGPSSDSYQNQDCLHLYSGWEYQWDDLNCVEVAWGGKPKKPNKPICQKRL